MVNTNSEWKYTENVEDSRRKALADPGSYENLVRLVTEEITDISVKPKPGKDLGLINCIQPVFSFELRQYGDALFNGPWGYRAQYLKSAAQGLASNCLLINSLSDKLLDSIDSETKNKFSNIDLYASLHAASAKFWFKESPSFLSNLSVDLDIEPWTKEAKRGNELAVWGICAPKVTTFEVKGALIDSHGNEVVPRRKILRHYDIHNYGFS